MQGKFQLTGYMCCPNFFFLFLFFICFLWKILDLEILYKDDLDTFFRIHFLYIYNLWFLLVLVICKLNSYYWTLQNIFISCIFIRRKFSHKISCNLTLLNIFLLEVNFNKFTIRWHILLIFFILAKFLEN